MGRRRPASAPHSSPRQPCTKAPASCPRNPHDKGLPPWHQAQREPARDPREFTRPARGSNLDKETPLPVLPTVERVGGPPPAQPAPSPHPCSRGLPHGQFSGPQTYRGREDTAQTPPADLGKLRTRGKVTWTVSLGPGLAAPSQPTCLEGQGRLRAQQIGQADLGRPKEEDMAIRDPSLSPSRRRPSPPPRVILGRVIQPPPGAASQAAEGHALFRIRGTALHLDGRGSGELGTLSRRPPPRLGWTRRTSPGASPSSAITQWPLSRHSVLPVMSEARETDSRGPLARPGAGTRVPGPRCSGSR